MGEAIIEVRDLHKAFGAQQVLRGIDLRIATGQTTVIIGGSGSGKSVLLKHLIALMRPDHGEVRFHGQDLFSMTPREVLGVRSKFGMLFQNSALFDSMNVFDNIAFPLREHRRKLKRSEVRELVMDSLQSLNLYNVEHKFPAQLSGGMRKRVALARATILRPEIVLYDEPTTGLDPIMIKQVDDMIAETAERLNITSVVISHDMASTFRIGHFVAMLHRGKIIAYGTPDEILHLADPRVREFIHVDGSGALGRHNEARA